MMRAAYMRREWVVIARSLLKDPAERCQFYDLCFSHSLDIECDEVTTERVHTMFAMIITAIEEDKSKYNERCERSRARALTRTRTDAQELPTTTPTPTTTTTPTPTPTPTLSLNNSSESNEERERFLFYGSFFARGCLDFEREADRCWNYYAALGWRNNKGTIIANRCAAAAMWRISGETMADPAPQRLWYDVFKSSIVYNLDLWRLFVRFAVSDGGVLNIYLRNANGAAEGLVNALEEGCQKQLSTLARRLGASTIEYRIG